MPAATSRGGYYPITMKDKILELLRGETLDGYLTAIQMLEDHTGTSELPDSDLGQEIIERGCAIFLIERWNEFDDYIAALQRFTDILPDYEEYLQDSDISWDLRGVSIFINGLIDGVIDVSGFIYPAYDPYVMAHTSARSAMEFFEAKQDSESAAFFGEISAYFNRIFQMKWSMGKAIRNIKTWNNEMAQGFYNILVGCDVANQQFMLVRLDDVLEQPAVRDAIFGKYLAVIKKVEAQYKKANDTANLDDVKKLKKMVVDASKGK